MNIAGGSRQPVLARAFFALSIVLVLAVTLVPSEPEGDLGWKRILCVLCGPASLADAVANIALFVPLGVALGRLGYAPLRAALFAAALSLSVEVAQFAIPGRDPSLGDFVFNTAGAALGSWLARSASRWVYPEQRIASRLSLAAAAAAGAVLLLTDVLFTASLPQTTYFAGSKVLEPSRAPLRIGGNTYPGEYFLGRIDDVRIYRRALTPSEIQVDMNTPVTAGAESPDLVAAYSFDERSGVVLRDVSGRGNNGQIIGATWTSQGKFGGALAFDGVDDVVVVPHSPSLNLSNGMTLEAWIYPVMGQNGWHAILQKEVDTYFLDASSDAGALKPAGGGTFGTSTEDVSASSAVPVNRWTHLALTYDGALLQLNVDGKPVAHRFRWYSGDVLDVSLDGLAILGGASPEPGPLRDRFASGAPLRVHAIAGRAAPTEVPLVTVHDALQHKVLLLGVEHDDLVFRFWTRAAVAKLDTPVIRARGVMRGVRPGDDLVVTLSRPARRYCLEVNATPACGLGFTLGMGWALVLDSQIPAGWPHDPLNAVWMASLLVATGFWVRCRWESALAVLILTAGIVLPCTLGTLAISRVEITGAFTGFVAGMAAARWVARNAPSGRAQ